MFEGKKNGRSKTLDSYLLSRLFFKVTDPALVLHPVPAPGSEHCTGLWHPVPGTALDSKTHKKH